MSEHIATTTQFTRRTLLQIATACGLSFAIPGMSARAASARGKERKKSLVTLWLAGGPSQLETWDPHPETAIGGPTRAIPTRIPDLKIAEHFPQVAEQIDALSVIRSLVSKEGDHERGTYLLKTGYRPDPTLKHPAAGAIVTTELPDPTLEIPAHISLGNSQWPARGGYLGDELDAFKVFDPGRNLHNMRPPVSDAREKRRVDNLNAVSKTFRAGRATMADKTLHQHTVDRALTMMSSDQLQAFELDDEPAAVLSAYGDSSFGRGCLVARRLIETGVRAVEVTLQGFDTHANNFEGHAKQAAILDGAFATLIRELKERDLLETTVVLCIGEFGRTPKINPLDGRDHWPSGFSCVLGGGGLRKGVVIGSTDPEGAAKNPQDPVAVADLYATVFTALGVDFAKEVMTPIGRPMAYCQGKPIERLVEA
jgi:hypothetical protein